MNIYQDIHCPHFIPCSGCVIDEKVNRPPLLEEIHHYFNETSTPFEYFSDKVVGWRYRAKLAVRGSWEDPQVGLYEAGTHHVVNIPLCRVHHPLVNKAVDELKAWIRTQKIQPYNEISQKGLLRYIQCVVERSTGRVQLVLVLNEFDREKISPLLNRLWEQNSGLWHSLWVNFNNLRTNTIFGHDWHLIKGDEYVWETLAGAKCCFHPANFAQANLDVFEHLLMDLKNQILPQQKIVEYYAGVGVIGLCLAQTAKNVHCCEINPFAETSFKKAHREQKESPISFYTGSASDHLELLKERDVVVVDPPRKGLDKPLLKALVNQNSLKEFWYISCGWPSFKKDSQDILKSWRLVKAKAYLFFPGTDHLEILAKFVK